MTISRRLGGGLVWIVACLLGLVSVLLCVTVILLPLGLPLLRLSQRLFNTAVKLWMPRGVSHPLDELGKATRKKARRTRKYVRRNVPTAQVEDAAKSMRKGLRRQARRARKQIRS